MERRHCHQAGWTWKFFFSRRFLWQESLATKSAPEVTTTPLFRVSLSAEVSEFVIILVRTRLEQQILWGLEGFFVDYLETLNVLLGTAVESAQVGTGQTKL